MEGSFVVSRKYENKLDIKTRKERGIYYTPYVVVKYILDNTIGKHDIVQNPYPKILDMSCGCGNFLIQAYTMLYKKFYDNIDKLNQRYGQDFICKEDIGLHIIKNCIFGVDTDNDALIILENELKKILKKELRETYKHKPLIRDDDLDEILDEEYLDKLNIFCGDSLKNDLSEVFGVDKFDYIIGNPPYVGQKYLDNNYKKFLYKEFEEVYKNKGDLYFCFYKKILDLLRQGGKSGIITPRYFMQSPSGKYLRSYLVNNSQIEKIIDFLGANLFKGLGVASCIVIFGHKIETDNKNNCLELYKIKNENINIIDEDVATCLYTGLVTDTGNFVYSNTHPSSFEMAKELLLKGAKKDTIIQKVFQSNPYNYYKLLGEALNTLDIVDGKIASITITKEMLKRNVISFNDVDGITSYTRDIEGVEVGILLKEKKENEVKVSLRSKNYVDVSKLAQSFNGGGHIRAAGCTIYSSIEDAKKKIVEAVVKAVQGEKYE